MRIFYLSAAAGIFLLTICFAANAICMPPSGGDYSLTENCSFQESMDGVDNGDLIIPAGFRLTINPGQIIVFNPGKKVVIQSFASLFLSGRLQKSYIWMYDNDGDGWPYNNSQYYSIASPGAGYRRRYTQWNNYTTVITGDGSDGFLNVTTTNYTDMAITGINFNVSAGTSRVNVTNATNFTVGNEIIIIQMLGPTTGTYETAYIGAVAPDHINITTTFQHDYFHNRTISAQVIKVPHYTNVTINQGGTLTVKDWNGTIGGIMFFRVQDTLNVSGNMSVAGKGYTGGSRGTVGSGGSMGGNGVESGDQYWACNGGGGSGGPGPGTDADGGNGGGFGQGGCAGGTCPDPTSCCIAGHGGNGGNGGYGDCGGNGVRGTGPGGGGGATSCGNYGAGGTGGNNSATNSNFSTIGMGGGGGGTTSGGGGQGGGGGGGGGGVSMNTGGGSAGVQPGLSQTAGSAGGQGGSGGDGGGLVMIYANVIDVKGFINASGTKGGSGGTGGAGGHGGRGGDGRDATAAAGAGGGAGGGGNGGQGGDGGHGGGGGSGGAIRLSANIVNLGVSRVVALGGAGGAYGTTVNGGLAANGGTGGTSQGSPAVDGADGSAGNNGGYGADGNVGYAGMNGTIMVEYMQVAGAPWPPPVYNRWIDCNDNVFNESNAC